jgi:hypothetical protein
MNRGKLKRLIFCIVFLPVALLWGELFVRILLPQSLDQILSIFREDPVVGYIYQPNAMARETGREYDVEYRTNSMGLRDREYDLTERGVFRVLLLGDSFSESHGMSLEKSLPKQIEQSLQRELDKRGSPMKAQVVNASFGGYSPYHYWRSYSRWKEVFKPHLVLVGFSMGNDFQCENDNIRYRIDNGEIVGIYAEGQQTGKGEAHSIRDMRKWAARTSELYVLLRNYFYYNDLIGRFTKEAKARESTRQMEIFVVPESQAVASNRSRCFGYLKRLKDEATADGVPVALLPIPNKFEIEQDYLRQVVEAQGLNRGRIDLEQPYNEIASFCTSNAIVYLDPRAAMRGADTANNHLYFRYDGHWNAKGIEIAAQAAVVQWQAKRVPPFNG